MMSISLCLRRAALGCQKSGKIVKKIVWLHQMGGQLKNFEVWAQLFFVDLPPLLT